MAYVGNKRLVVVDEKEHKAYDGIAKGTPIFSPDSTRMAYVALAGNKYVAVVDEKEEKSYDFIGTIPIFSPDSRWVVYAAQISMPMFDSETMAQVTGFRNRQLVVINGKEQKPYDTFIAGGKLLFDSPDSFHYLAEDRNIIYLVEETLKQQ